ncbi:uncharacterized protein FYW61_021880 [Anableps anableps]
MTLWAPPYTPLEKSRQSKENLREQRVAGKGDNHFHAPWEQTRAISFILGLKICPPSPRAPPACLCPELALKPQKWLLRRLHSEGHDSPVALARMANCGAEVVSCLAKESSQALNFGTLCSSLPLMQDLWGISRACTQSEQRDDLVSKPRV